MGENKKLNQILDEIIDDAARAAVEDIGNRMSDPQEEMEFSERHEKIMQQLFQKERKKARKKKWISYTKRAACFLLLLVVVSGITIFSVDAWRIKFLNFVLESGEPNTNYNFNEGGNTYSDEEITLGYLPEGFELVENTSNRESITLTFAKDDWYFTFTVNSIDATSSVDTQDGSAERITINGNEAIFTTNPNMNAVIWHDDKYSYRVIGNITKEELIQIAKNVEK